MTSPTTTEIVLKPKETATVQHVTSQPVATKDAGQEPSALRRLCTWCGDFRWELAPSAANLTVTGLAWAEHLHGVGGGVGLVYGLGVLGAVGTTALGLKEKHLGTATAGALAAGALVEVGVNAASGISPAGLIATALVTIGSYIPYLHWLHKSGKGHRGTGSPTAIPATAGSPLAAAGTAMPSAVLPGPGLAATDAAPLAAQQSPQALALWHGLAALGVVPLAVDNYVADANGWSATVTLPPGKATSPATVKAQREQLATNMGMTGRLRLSAGANGNQLKVRVDLHDALADAIPWPGPSITSVKQLMTLGVFEDGDPILLDLMKDHILIAGATDAGKSGVQSAILGNLAACSDAEVLGVDMKPGALELGPWEDTMLMLADTADEAAEVFAAVIAEMHRRGRHLATLRGPDGEKIKKWVAGDPNTPEDSPEWGHGPFWYLIIDELAELLRQAPDLVNELLTMNQVARAMGIRIIAATQSPSEKAFGGKGTDARQQYSTRIGLGVAEPITVNLILGPGAYGAGWALDDLDKPGKLMISNRMYKTPKEGRCYWVSDKQVMVTNETYRKDRRMPSPTEGRLLKAVPTFPDGSPVPANRIQLWLAIDRAGANGTTISGLLGQNINGLNTRTAISDPIQAWRAKGWLVDIGVTDDRSKVFASVLHSAAA